MDKSWLDKCAQAIIHNLLCYYVIMRGNLFNDGTKTRFNITKIAARPGEEP